MLPWWKIFKILEVAKDKCKLCPVPTRKACWSHPQIAIWNCFANTQAVLLQTHRTLRVSELQWCIFLSQQDLNLFLIPPEWKGRKNMCLSQAIRKGKKNNLSPHSLLNILNYKKSIPSAPIFLSKTMTQKYQEKNIDGKIVSCRQWERERKNNLPSAPNLFAPGKPSEPLGDLLRNWICRQQGQFKKATSFFMNLRNKKRFSWMQKRKQGKF